MNSVKGTNEKALLEIAAASEEVSDKLWPPTKEVRENWEILKFVSAYADMTGEQLSVIKRRDKPDFWVFSNQKQCRYGVELTSAYINDESCDTLHKVPADSYPQPIYHDPARISTYLERLVSIVARKVKKARQGYDTSSPLILSVYCNEYEAILLKQTELKKMMSANSDIFNDLSPFKQVLFWGSIPGNFLVPEPGSVE